MENENWRDFRREAGSDVLDSGRVMHPKRIERMVYLPERTGRGILVRADGEDFLFDGKMYHVAMHGCMQVGSLDTKAVGSFTHPVVIASFARMLVNSGNLACLCATCPWSDLYGMPRENMPKSDEEIPLFGTIEEAKAYADRFHIKIHDENVRRVRFKPYWEIPEGVTDWGEYAFEYEAGGESTHDEQRHGAI